MTVVRIATEAQYRLPDSDLDRLNELDNQAQEAVEANDEGRFQELLAQMVELVRSGGEALSDDELVESEIILPWPHSTIVEVGEAFKGEGLIPG
ncbi:MAG: PspA-associated protein PspAA [Solirubrobacteraceae bacterium]